MKKSLLKVKNTITFEDKLNAIDLILNAFWDDETGEYIPWMEEPARIIEGYTLEDGENIFKLYLSDDDLKSLIDTFINPDYESRCESVKEYIKVMDFVDKMVHDKLEWTKQNIIHANPDMDRIIETNEKGTMRCMKASQDIIDAKNEQIKKLQEENKELKKVKGNFSARNVMNDGSGTKNNNKTGTKVTKMDKKK